MARTTPRQTDRAALLRKSRRNHPTSTIYVLTPPRGQLRLVDVEGVPAPPPPDAA